jgi:hypothetical protein
MIDSLLPTEPKIKLTKLEAACRQLNTAIRLWFSNGDPVSIFALAYPAHEIVHRLYRHRGLMDLIYDSKLIKEEYREQWAKGLKRGASFLKHADKDPHAIIEFDPNLTLMHIIGSVLGLSRMGVAPSDEMAALLTWLYIHFPSWFHSESVENFVPAKALAKFRRVEKRQFFESYLRALNAGLIERPAGMI